MQVPVAILLAVMIAGCTEPMEKLDAGPRTDEGAERTGTAPFTPLTFDGPDAYYYEQWNNGSFAPHESGWPTGGPRAAATGQAYWDRTFDITEHVPLGVPVLIKAVGEADVGSGPWPRGGNIYLNVRGDLQDVIMTQLKIEGGGHREFSVLLQAVSGKPIVVAIGYWSMAPSVEVAYSIHTVITANRSLVPAAMHAALDFDSGETVRFEPEAGRLVATLWNPDDQVATQINSTEPFEYTVPDDTPGTYVLLNHQQGAPFRILTDSSQSRTLNLLPLEWVEGSPPRLVSTETVWETSVKRPILRAGVMMRSTDSPHYCDTFNVQITTSTGKPVVEGEYDEEDTCAGVPPLSEFEWFQGSMIGDPNLLGNDFKIRVQAPAATNMEALDWYRHYKRSA